MPRRNTNAFGEPWQGSKIQGAGALARARGHAYGSLTSQQRGAYGSQKNFQRAAETAASREAAGESDSSREERLKQQGREEVLNRQPEFVKPMTTNATPPATSSVPRPPQKAAQNREIHPPRMGERWSKGVDIPGMGKVGLDRRPSPLQPAKPRVKWDTPTPSPEAMRSLRRKMNRAGQMPRLLSSGQVDRSNW